MRKFITLLFVVVFATACSRMTKSGKLLGAHPQPTPQQMQEAMIKASTIGANHRKLDALVGKYKVSSKFWMNPGMEAETATGTADFQWVLGGHYLEMNYHSKFQGQPFDGRALYGYNNVGAQYESTWIDSMGTEIMKSEGQPSQDGSAIIFTGEVDCPMTNGPIKTRGVLTIGTNRHTFEMYRPAFDGSGEFRDAEIVFEKVTKPVKGTKKSKKK